jgi:ribose transport system permease protein
MTAIAAGVGTRRGAMTAILAWLRRNGWSLGLMAFLVLLFIFTKTIQPRYGIAGIQGLSSSILPIAFATVGQAIVVIAGGIDLSVGAMMAFTNVVAASLMKDQSDQFGFVVVAVVLLLGLAIGAINGALVVVTRVPDIVVTLAMSFVWFGCALLVLNVPGGGAAKWLKDLVLGSIGPDLLLWVPKSAIALVVLVLLIWLPVRRSRLGLSLYAVGSDQLAAFRSGVSVGRTKIAAYSLLGLFSALAGLSLTANTGIGAPNQGSYTLQSVAAVVLGGVSLAGGRGGVLGPLVAVIVLALIRTDMTFLGVDPSFALSAQGIILIAVVMVGVLVQLRRSRS